LPSLRRQPHTPDNLLVPKVLEFGISTLRRDPSRESSIFRHPRLCLVLLADVGEIPGYHRGAVLTLTLDSGRSVYSVSLRRSARLQWIFSSELPRSRAHIPHRMSRFRAFGDSSMGKEHHADQSRVEGNGHLAYKINDLRHCDVPCSACVLFRFGSLFHSAYFLTTTLCLAVVCIAIRLSWAPVRSQHMFRSGACHLRHRYGPLV